MGTGPSLRLMAAAKRLADEIYRAAVVGPVPSRQTLMTWERLAQQVEDGLIELQEDVLPPPNSPWPWA